MKMVPLSDSHESRQFPNLLLYCPLALRCCSLTPSVIPQSWDMGPANGSFKQGRTLRMEVWNSLSSHSPQVSSVTRSCLTLCDYMDCSAPGFPVHHQLQELNQTHVHWAGDVPTIPSSVVPFSSCLQSFPASGSFLRSQFFESGGQSTGVSVSASVLQMNIQDWFPSGLTSWIFLQSRGLSRVFSNTTVQKHQFFSTQPSL